MAWNFLLMAAGLAGLAGVGVAYQPDFDFQLAAPSSTPRLTALADYQKPARVSVKFQDAKVGEVLKWLERQGVSFVIADTKLKDRSITLSIQDQPVDAVADAIASALGGHWERQGAIRVFREGAFSWLFEAPSVKGELIKPDGKNLLKDYQFQETPMPRSDGNQMKVFTLPDQDGKTFQFFGNGFNTPSPFGQRMYNFNGQVPTDPAKLKELEQKITDELNRLHEEAKSQPKTRFEFKDPFFGPRPDFDAFSKSLTDSQKDLMKSQGFLKLDDLTSEQRTLLGLQSVTGHVEVRYEKDGTTIVIKN